MNEQLPIGRVLFRFATMPEDNVTGHDDMAEEYAVIENSEAPAGLIVYAKYKRYAEWIANPWSDRHLIKRLLKDGRGTLTTEQIERMVKDANFVNGDHVYAPVMFNDLCCHVRALAAEVEELTNQLVQIKRDNAELVAQALGLEVGAIP